MSRTRMLAALFPLALSVCCVCGCAPLRFVVDAVPARDELTESVVLEAEGHRSSHKVALIELSGLIADFDPPGLVAPGENPLGRFVEELEMARRDARVEAVIVRLNSPGGTVTASDTIYREIMHFRQETGKPVIMLMADVAASGAYYIACAGDEIIASPTTTTGSVGVIIQTFNFSEGMEKIGISAEAITSGPNKAVASPFEAPVAEHREILQQLVDEFYVRFLELVEHSRPISPADMERIADGRVISGVRAAEIGLVDSTGDLRDALAAALSRADIDSARLIRYHRPIDHIGSAYAATPHAPAAAASQINLLQLNLGAATPWRAPGFYYLWDPSIEW